MKARGIVGQRIVAIHHEWLDSGGRMRSTKECTYIELENGIRIVAQPYLTETDPLGYLLDQRPTRTQRRNGN